MTREPNISEQQAREIVDRMGRRESRSEKSMDDFYRNLGLNPEELAQPEEQSQRNLKPPPQKSRERSSHLKRS